MEIEHYFDTMKVLAIHAGFVEPEAQIIAYASQYVDDAQEPLSMTITNLDDLINAVPDVVPLNLIVSARRPDIGHDDLQTADSASTEGRARAALPYHFVPTTCNDNDAATLDCAVVGELVDKAINALHRQSREHRIKNLIRLGIALHSFIDGWMHQRFAGMFGWIDMERKAAAVQEMLHAKAHSCPDSSHHFRSDFNPKVYMEAAEMTYGHLLTASGSGCDNWDAIKVRMWECASYRPLSGFGVDDQNSAAALTQKKIKFIATFPEANLGTLKCSGKIVTPEDLPHRDYVHLELAGNAYNKFDWKREACSIRLNPVSLSRRVFECKDAAAGAKPTVIGEVVSIFNEPAPATSISTSGETQERFEYHFKGDRKWVWFHTEAQRHRLMARSCGDRAAPAA